MSDTLIFGIDEPPVKLLLVLVLALLICNAARGLASRLARGLAFAAATVFNGFNNVLGFNGLNSVHWFNPPL